MDDRVSTWLGDLGLEVYRESFQQNAITWDVLTELNNDDLASLGVLLGHRKKLLRAIAQLAPTDSADAVSHQPVRADQKPTLSPLGRDGGERRQLTIMFCDLVGSTALSNQLDPEDLQTAIRRFLDTCTEAISRFDGYIAKYMGDGLLVYFGYPHAYEHDAERAIHAGLAVLNLVQALPREDPNNQKVDIAARIGVATGQVIVGQILGQEAAKERSVFGETPNLAARLQALADPNQLIIDSTTKRLVGNEFELSDLGSCALKGFETPVHAWRVHGIKPSTSRFESYRSDRLSVLIGREHETALLLGRWDDVVCGEGQVAVLLGEAGIGKSRMVRGLRDQLDEGRYSTIQLQSSPYHTTTVLYPVVAYLRQAAGLNADDTPVVQLQKLHSLAINNSIDDQTMVSLLAELLSIPADTHSQPPNIPPEKRKEMTLNALVHVLRKWADRSPTLLIVEDAHWLDPTTLDLLTRIIDHIQTMRVFLVITFRPDVTPPWSGYSHVTFLTLTRLSRRHSAELLASMTRGKTLPREVQEAILAKTDGVPLYIEELTANVLGSGLLVEEDNSYRLTAPLTELAIPDSLQALLMERIDRLGPAKDIIQLGATIGREFSYELLRGTVDVTEGELNNALHLLNAAGHISQEGDIPAATYLFKHALIQDAAYNTLPKKSRRVLHARIANTLERKFAERVKTEPELLAYHYEQAGEIRSAIQCWHLAARRDVGRSADAEALSHFDRTVGLLKTLPLSPERDAVELELLIGRGAPLLRLQGYASDEIEKNYSRARSLSQEHPESEGYFLSIWGLWVFHLVRGPLAKAGVLADSLLSWATHRQNPDLLIRAHESAGSTYSFLGRFREAKTHLTEAKSLYDPARHRSHVLPYTQDPGITARIMVARTAWILGELDEVESPVEEALAMARELEHPFTLAFTLATASWVYSTLHDTNRTLSLTEEAVMLSSKYSFEVPLAWAMCFQGWALAEQGQEKGLERLVEGLSAAQRAHASLNNTYSLALLAEIYLRHKRIDDGLKALADAHQFVQEQGERCWQAELFRLKGHLLLEQSDPSLDAAEQCFTDARNIAREQQARMLELRATTSLAALLYKLDRSDTAKQLLSATLSQFGVHPANRDWMNARTILDQLNGVS